MKHFLCKLVCELVRVGFSAALAALGLSVSGCIALGDGANASASPSVCLSYGFVPKSGTNSINSVTMSKLKE